MKRIITCPKCEAKLAIFDLGKPINQKCPKCGNAFVVESEENKSEAKKPEQADDAKQTAEPAPAPAPAPAAEAAAAAAAKDDAAAAAPVPAANEKKPGKENGKKKTAPVAEAAAAVPAAEPAAAPAAAQTPAEEKKDAAPKEIKVKKPTESSAFVPKARTPDKADLSASDVPETSEAPAGGGSFISRLVVVGLLFLIIILQVIAKAQSNKQYGKIIEHLQFIETKLAK